MPRSVRIVALQPELTDLYEAGGGPLSGMARRSGRDSQLVLLESLLDYADDDFGNGDSLRDTVGEFEVWAPLGSGSSSKAEQGARFYAATDLGSDAAVAIKMVSLEDAHSRDEARAAMLTSASAVHANIVANYGWYYSYTTAMLYGITARMEMSLATYVDAKGRLCEDSLRVVIRPLLCALDHLHNQGVIHRDVKPSNLLVSEGLGRVVLSDFGQAVTVDPRTKTIPEGSVGVAGTALYMSPQRVVGGLYGTAEDIWSVGMMVGELLIGRHPLVGSEAGGLVALASQLRAFANDSSFPVDPLRYFGEDAQNPISSAARDFVRLCLQPSAGSRPAASALLGHMWLVKGAGRVV